MRNLAIAGMVILTAIMVATFASADSVGIGIKKTAPISGTGSSGSPLKIDVCLSGSAYVSNGTSWACGALGGVSDGDKTDITVSASGATWTIDVAAVTLAKMADLAADTIIGRANGAGTGVPTALTAAQVNTILPVATATVKGLVPTPPNNTTTFLRGDATFATPTGLISGLTTNTIPKATSATAIGNSSVTDSGSLVTVTNPLTVTGAATLNSTLAVTGLATLTGGVVELRAKGLRSREYLDLAWCYEQAVKQRVASERAEKKAARHKPHKLKVVATRRAA